MGSVNARERTLAVVRSGHEGSRVRRILRRGIRSRTLAIDLHWTDAHIGGKPYGLDPTAPSSMATTEDTTPQDTLDMVRDEHLVFVHSILAAAQRRHQRSPSQPAGGGGGFLTKAGAANIIDVALLASDQAHRQRPRRAAALHARQLFQLTG